MQFNEVGKKAKKDFHVSTGFEFVPSVILLQHSNHLGKQVIFCWIHECLSRLSTVIEIE